MKKVTKLEVLKTLFVISLVISNVVAAKVVYMGFEIRGTPIVLPGAVFAYAITFLMTDVIGELYGKEEAHKTVVLGFFGQATATVLLLLTQFLPALDGGVQEAYLTILGQNYMFVIGSLIAYFASQSWDVYFFHKIRSKYISKHGHNKGRWIWNNVSTMTSQVIDTLIFITISFGVGFKWLWLPGMSPVLIGMIITQYLFKFALAAVDTPFFYLLTRPLKEDK